MNSHSIPAEQMIANRLLLVLLDEGRLYRRDAIQIIRAEFGDEYLDPGQTGPRISSKVLDRFRKMYKAFGGKRYGRDDCGPRSESRWEVPLSGTRLVLNGRLLNCRRDGSTMVFEWVEPHALSLFE